MVGHEIEERRDRRVLRLVLRRGGARPRQVPQRPLVVDRHVAHVADVLRRVLRLVFRIEQVAGAREDQRLRLDGLERLLVVAVHARRRPEVVLVVGPALVHPVDRVHAAPARVLHPLEEADRVLAAGEARLLEGRRAHDHAAEPARPQPHALLWRRARRVVASAPLRVGHDALAQHLQHAGGPRGGAAEGNDGNDTVHHVRIADGPLQRLHAAHRRPDHRHELLDPEFLRDQALLRAHHVADVELRKLHLALRLAVRGRGREAVADRVGRDNEVLGGVERAVRADEVVDAVMVAADRGHHEDRVRLARVQRAVRDVGDAEVSDRAAALELEVAHAVRLVRWISGRMRCGGGGENRGEAQDLESHLVPPFSVQGASYSCDARLDQTGFQLRLSVTPSAPGDPLASFRLDDRLIVVTGASEGIGRAFAEHFARAGAEIVLSARRKDMLESVREGIAAAGGRAEVVAADVTRMEDIANLAKAVGRIARGRKLVLVNNAGFGFTKAALEVTEEDWDRLFDTHAKGTFFCCQKIGALMLERGYGKIVNLSSSWSAATDPGKAPYGAAKAAVSHLTAQLSAEWAPRGVRVNAIAPTATLTDFVKKTFAASPERAERLKSRIKLGRFAQPSDLLGAALFLASAASDFVTGQTLFVDGGFTT